AGNGNTGVVPPQLGGSPIPGTSAASRGEGNVWGTRVMADGSTAPRRTGGSIMAERARKGKPAQTTPLTSSGSAAPNAPIKDFKTTTSAINITDDLSITGVKVNVNIAHTYIGDLVVKLRSPEGKEVTLHNREGGSTDNLVLEANPTDFNGLNSKGAWSLIVQ